MSIEHSVEITASRKQVFALYADVASWPEWDCETLAVELPGLRVGATGWLKPRQGPRANIRISEVTEGSSFTVEGRLPLCRMHFGHELEGDGNRTTATHWVRFTGLLAPLFSLLIGSGIDRTLPQTLAGLKRVSEEKLSNG